jgi:hypothetical protein
MCCNCNGSLINGATGQLFKNTGFGNYSVKVTLLGCSSISELFVITGTEDNFEQLVNLYPNPSNGSFTIDLPFFKEVRFTVYNSLGNEVYRNTISQIRQASKLLNLTSLLSGAYILRIEADGRVVNKKIIIQ